MWGWGRHRLTGGWGGVVPSGSWGGAAAGVGGTVGQEVTRGRGGDTLGTADDSGGGVKGEGNNLTQRLQLEA